MRTLYIQKKNLSCVYTLPDTFDRCDNIVTEPRRRFIDIGKLPENMM